MNKVARIFSYIAFVFAFCFMAIGYAAVQDTLLVSGSVSIEVPIKPFAVYGPIYDSDGQFVENALNFYNRIAVAVGDEIALGEGKQVVTEVYADIATLALTRAEKQPWFKHQTDINSIDVIDEGIQPTNMAHWFSGFGNCTSFNFEKLDTSKVTNMRSMFYGCSAVQTLNLNSFDTSKVTDMHSMFYECSALQTLNLNSFVTSKVTKMLYMFYGCSALQELDLTGFDTSKVTEMGYMFKDCTSLTHLDLSSFNTLGLVDAGMDEACVTEMFSNCSSLKTLDISSFNTEKMVSIQDMFLNCGALTTIYAGSYFDVEGIGGGFDGDHFVFRGCNSLIGGNGTGFVSTKDNTILYARIDGKKGLPGYLTGIVHIDLDANQTGSTLYGIKWDFNGTGNFNVDKESSIKLSVASGEELPEQVVLTSTIIKDGVTETLGTETVSVGSDGVVTIPAKLMSKYSTLTITKVSDTNSLNDETSENIVETIPLITHIENITWMPSGKLTANNDFGILMTANEGCIFPDTIMVKIEGVGYNVAANGEHKEGEPWFDPEENILYIPGTLLTESTKSVFVMAVAVHT